MSDERYNADLVRQQAQGQWDRIIAYLAPEMGPAIAAKGRGVSCPEHGGKSKEAFRVFGPRSKKGGFAETGGCVCNTCGTFGNGFLTLQWRLRKPGKSGFIEVVAQVAHFLGMSPEEQARRRPHQPALVIPTGPTAEEIAAVEKGREKLAKKWDTALPLDHEDAAIARDYFKFRGLAVPSSMNDVRFVPSEPYYGKDPDNPDKSKFIGRFPALLAKVRNRAGRTYKLHRLYMEADGSKFSQGDRKKMTHDSADLLDEGLHIEVFRSPGGYLGLTEGIENSVAVRLGSGMPCWATWSSSVMPAFPVPKGLRHLFIWADRDTAGLKNAIKLKERLAVENPMLSVTILLPPQGMDWNDVYEKLGTAGFRTPEVWQAPSIEVAA
ncbi:MAG: hypothetical protein F8N36_14020 [Desulfovibrio sp.]|uniref:toprim domain-containing protein n=1 Tax=Desulfovibrio sp. TaxID=885 RepID=UPI00135ED04B|nr:toprim domain-containing protein [Desulfovibrio sp.]MTJ93955.1 hypothetical protein [Desulfovibrio sp.]